MLEFFSSFLFASDFRLQKKKKKHPKRENWKQTVRRRGGGDAVWDQMSERWRRSCGDARQLGVFSQTLRAGRSVRPAVPAPGQTHSGSGDRPSTEAPARISQGSPGSARICTQERRSWRVGAESAHSGWGLLQEGRASDWTPASGADPSTVPRLWPRCRTRSS